VYHDHDVGFGVQGLGVAGLLVAAVAHVALVQKTANPQPPGHLQSLVMGGVVHQQDLVHYVRGDILIGALQGSSGVIGGHDYQDSFSQQHSFPSPWDLL